jgi:hypothetical protein
VAVREEKGEWGWAYLGVWNVKEWERGFFL